MNKMEQILRNLSYGLYLIGVEDNGRPCGCIVNTVFQVTSENPIVAISMNKNNYTWELIERTGRFSVSILSEKTRKEVIQKLGFVSGRDHDKYEGIDYTMHQGLPVLNEECSGALLCKVVSMAETPTHMVILASVEDAIELTSNVPMTYRYYHEVIRGGAPKNAPSYIAPEKTEKQAAEAQRWVCDVCGYVYEGDLTKEPDSYVCPLCGVDKSHFQLYTLPKAKNKTAAERWVCDVCGYVYEGDLTREPDSYTCPLCGVDKSHFHKELQKEETTMAETERWVCDVCGYVYEGDLTQEPDDYVCPLCGVDKSHFTKE